MEFELGLKGPFWVEISSNAGKEDQWQEACVETIQEIFQVEVPLWYVLWW